MTVDRVAHDTFSQNSHKCEPSTRITHSYITLNFRWGRWGSLTEQFSTLFLIFEHQKTSHPTHHPHPNVKPLPTHTHSWSKSTEIEISIISGPDSHNIYDVHNRNEGTSSLFHFISLKSSVPSSHIYPIFFICAMCSYFLFKSYEFFAESEIRFFFIIKFSLSCALRCCEAWIWDRIFFFILRERAFHFNFHVLYALPEKTCRVVEKRANDAENPMIFMHI